jgi:hypothetical protein
LDLLVQFADSAEVVNAGVDSLRKALGPVALPARSLLVVDRYFFSELEKLEDVSKDPADIKVADSPLFHFFSLVSEWRVDVVDVITAKPTTWKDGNFENHGRRITSLLANYELNWRRTLTQPREPFRLNVRFASDRHQVVHDRLYVFGGSRDSIRDKLAAQGVSYFQDEFNKRAYHAALMSQSLGVFKAQQSEDLLSVQAVSSASAAAYLRQMGWAFSRSVTELKSHSNSPSGEYKAAGLTTEIFSNFGHVH